jgi:hypothetical protein
MILFTILTLALALVAAFVLTILGVVGGATLAVFGDLIVCVMIIVLIVKLVRKLK